MNPTLTPDLENDPPASERPRLDAAGYERYCQQLRERYEVRPLTPEEIAQSEDIDWVYSDPAMWF